LGALDYSGDQQALESLDRDINAAGSDATKLAPIERQLISLLRRTEATFAARQAAAQRLGRVLALGDGKIPPDALKPLAAMLAGERDSDLARLALEPVPGGVVDGMFADALQKADGRTRLGILDSIARRRSAAAVPTLARLLQDRDPATVAAAARALGEIADPASVAALHATAEPSPAPIAAAKLAAASRLPAAAALGLLNELQRKARDPVQRAAAFRQSLDIELGAAAGRIAEVLGGRDQLMKQVALESLNASRAPNLVATLAGKLNSWDAPTQRAVLAALGRRGDAAATKAVVTAVKHKDGDVRAAAIEALGSLPGTRDTVTLLAGIAADRDSDDAKLAQQALARLKGTDVAAVILAGAEKGDARRRAVFIEQLALRNMTEAVPLLIETRNDPDPAMRIAAVAALGDIAPFAEQKALLDWTVQASGTDEQSRALRSLVSVTARNPDLAGRSRALHAAIESAPSELAVRLLPALARLGDQASADAAGRLAIRDDAAVAEAATTALTRWTGASALPALASVAEKAARLESRAAAVEGVLRYFERNREPWSSGMTDVISRLLASTRETESRRKLVAVLHRADDRAALAAVEKLKADSALATAASNAADVIRANLAGPPQLRASNPVGVRNLIDGKTSTRWTTPALGEEWVEVDFKASRPIQRITLDQTGRAAEFPEQYEVFVTDDPKRPGEALASGKGQRTRTVIDLPAGTRGRYLIVKNIAERNETPWAICELYVD
jgi:HEAT repeat protein